MKETPVLREISPEVARRLAVSRQGLAGPRPAADGVALYQTVRELGCLQLDPISSVARSHLLVLHSRHGPFDPAGLDQLLWEERRLFEYWAHCASIVLTEDYPLHNVMMRHYALGEDGFAQRLRDWVAANDGLRAHILERITAEGPLPSKAFEAEAVEGWASTGWTAGRNVSRMLDYLWIKGELMVAGRMGGQKQWDLAERCLPDWTPREGLAARELTCRAVERSLRALGVARQTQISQHFLRGRYTGLGRVLTELEAARRIGRVRIVEDGRAWAGPWYIHHDDLPLLDRLAAGEWSPRTSLLSPFDNLICDRKRTEHLFGFRYRIEIYVPKEQRQYGYYVLPILHGDRLIGRVDPVLDRKRGVLTVNAVFAEPDTPLTGEVASGVAGAIAELAAFVGATAIAVDLGRVPAAWAPALRAL